MTQRQDNHRALDMMLAEYLVSNPGSMPSKISVMELIQWHDKKMKEELQTLTDGSIRGGTTKTYV